MSAAPALVFPGTRTLAAWWNQLGPRQPRRLWVSHLLLYRVEALATLERPVALDPLSRFILKALNGSAAHSLEGLDQRLHLGRPLLRQALRPLETDNLVASTSQGWTLTSAGRQAAGLGAFPRLVRERRPFYFVVSEQNDHPPHWVNLRDQTHLQPFRGPGQWSFDPRLLTQCVERPLAWKEAHGFPLEVTEVAGVVLPPTPGARPGWQEIMLARLEQLLAVLVLCPDQRGGDRLLGFAVQQDGWVIQGNAPAFALGTDWRETLPELDQDPPADRWREAWRSWCQPRGLSPAEIEDCLLERHENRLRVRTDRKVLERLRSGRNDVSRGEAWLLAGSGRLRTAAPLEVSATD